jgi:amino acid adenylation domain-containing protein
MSTELREERLRNLSPAKRAFLLQALRQKGAQRPEKPRITPRGTAGPALLSFAQRRLWFLDQIAPGGATYNIAFAVRLEGALDPAALAASLSAVVRRHEVLRSTFSVQGDEPVQHVRAAVPVPLPRIDLEALPPGPRETERERLAAHEASLPFDLTVGPLLRAWLLRLEPQLHVVLLTFHHIVSDGWSVEVFVREMAAFYLAIPQGRMPDLPELPVQYADFAEWQREWVQGEIREAQLAWWRERLAGAPDVLNLPTDYPRPAIQTHRGALLHRRIRAGLRAPIAALAHSRGATAFMVLFAGFQVLLWRWTAQQDLVVGTPIANRTRPEVQDLIGFFVNTLALRTDLSGDPPFHTLLERTREAVLGAYDHQDLPFEMLLEELGIERDLSRTPLVQALFLLQNAPATSLDPPGLRLSLLPSHSGTSKLDITLSLEEDGEAFHAALEHSTELFDATTMFRLLDQYGRLLEAIAANPGLRVSELPLLGEGERWQLLGEWNDTAVARAEGGGTLYGLFAAQAARTPGAEALVFEGERLTYRELERRAGALARRLRFLGVGPETVVGVLLDRSLEMVVSLYGVLQAGAAYLPLEPGHPLERLALLLEDARPALVLSRADLVSLLPEGMAKVELLEPGAPGEAEPLSPVDWDATLAYVIYTSGSTGRPKGAMVPHAGIRNRLLWMQAAYGLEGTDRVLQKTPFGFDVSVWELFWPLTVGACLVVARPEGHRDSAYVAELIGRERITTLHFVPSMLRVFLEEPDLSACRSLRRVICSGEALSAELVERFRRRLGHAELHNLYGPTEASVDVTSWACPREGAVRAVPIGRPVSNTSIHVLDEAFGIVPLGGPGELFIGGVQLARGYLAQPALTAERFVPDPFSEEPGARLYRTGDRVRRLSDGAVDYLGRLDFQVKIRGFRIELGEVEAGLAAHPAVRDAVALARPDGHGGSRLVAWIVPRAAPAPTPVELREHLLRRLPEPMVPTAFVFLEALPLTGSGKVDCKALPDPEAGRSGDPAGEVPRDALEKLLAEVWTEVLGLDRVGIDDSFFVVGGDSISALRVVNGLSERGLTLAFQEVYRHPTLRQLADWIRTSQPEAVAALGLDEAEDEEDLAFLLAELEQLSEEETRALLSAKRQSLEENA